MNKIYNKQLITRIRLDAQQAILNACVAGGVYLWVEGPSYLCSTQTVPGTPAQGEYVVTPKGGTGEGALLTGIASYSAPS